MEEDARRRLKNSLRRHLPGIPVWVYGSLARPGRFGEHSDIDLALTTLPDGMSLDYLQSLISRDVGREADVCLLQETRLREIIETGGRAMDPVAIQILGWFLKNGRGNHCQACSAR